MSVSQIKSATWQVSLELDWTLNGFAWAEHLRNFHVAELSNSKQTIFAIDHLHLPLIAFSFNTPDHLAPFEFASVYNVFGRKDWPSPFVCLDADLLKMSPLPEHLTDLAKAEIEQIKHWRPSRLGDIIFNDWD